MSSAEKLAELPQSLAPRARIPYGAWPRGLSAEEAAAYVGVSRNKFLAEVEEGLWPKPETRGSRKIWDRRRMDEAWDRRGETEGDPLMEALDDRET
jgi:hypothetical protein